MTILCQEAITTCAISPGWFVLVGFVFIALSIFIDFRNDNIGIALFALCVLSWAIGLIFSFAPFNQVETGRYKYKVTIDDTVDAKEFNEKYEVIEIDGDLWTIQDRSNS